MDNQSKIMVLVLVIICVLSIIGIHKCQADPIYIKHNGVKGYFIPEREFDLILKMMIEWEGRGKIIDNLDLQVEVWKRKEKRVRGERDIWRACEVITLVIWGGLTIWKKVT